MDYGRIYREFIADRRGREPFLQGYTERHHILPRCLGGGDEPDNLIDMTAEDHFFAHLLLAKMHGGRLWFAVIRMSASRTEGKRGWVRQRYMYGVARRRLAQQASDLFTGQPGLKGGKNGNFNPKLYSWVNLDTGEARESTLHGMWQLQGGARPAWTKVAQGVTQTYRGWTIKGRPIARRNAKGKVHHFVNSDGRVFCGTQVDFAAFASIRQAGASRVVNHNAVTACGWRKAGALDRLPNAPRDGTRPGKPGTTLALTDGRNVIVGDRVRISSFLGATPAQVSAGIYSMKKGLVASYKGWRLAA